PGGIRTDLKYEGTAEPVTNEDGVVTFEEAAVVQPFANTLVTMDLTGAQVLEVLEQQWQPETASRPFLKLGVAGLTYQYDPTAPAGERITKVMLDSGEEFDEAATYRIVVNSFLASGGDNFTAFTGGANVADSGRIDLDVFVAYIGEFGTEESPLMPDYGQRAIGVVDVNGNGEAIESGQEIAIDLSSLLFSTNEPKAENVVVTFDGQVLGTFPIDPSIVDETDEVGRAQVRVTIPNLDGYDKGELVTLAVHLDSADGDTVLEWTYEMEGSDDDGGGVTPPMPDTGADVADLGLIAGALLLMGVGGLYTRRRMMALQ
ncbi:MAG: 5'-nucleotidase C-terminal domain-containing protein, partial [Actinomycetes bacterium]|nr:5'-nucleotidase C-terminal domain-containing protein [Actinomycetes bacterium]MDX5380804.1 5'-nucleotidase C-terminal domain-containing protein [Actinomycetes bacterium]MDX5399853.1 5'-nucleotidase C-terminal domain-containing protein [Actinomycetes bacterium]MDX5450549.1 5'-nucleotidase C-terminal domain-containing protein [Actinomycetes bacterium]